LQKLFNTFPPLESAAFTTPPPSLGTSTPTPPAPAPSSPANLGSPLLPVDYIGKDLLDRVPDIDRNAFEISRLLGSGAIGWEDITNDERINMIRVARDNGSTIDAISGQLQIPRKVVESDFKAIDIIYKTEFFSKDLEGLAGEIYAITMTTVNKAIKAEKFTSVAGILQTMVETLQSMGVVYRAPQKSQVAALIGVTTNQVGQRAFNQYQDAINNDRAKVIDTMTKLLTAVRNNDIGS